MSTVRKHETDSPDANLFRYGWRDVLQVGKDGRKEWVRLPLTLEDVLHPQQGDTILESDDHRKDLIYLVSVLVARLAQVVGAVVLSDCEVIWDNPQIRSHSPDVAVIFGVKRPRRWRSFDVAAVGVRPILIIEVTSPTTRRIDLHTKRRQYYRLGVEWYAIVDELPARGDRRRLRVLGYRRGQRGYQRLPLNPAGRLWLDPVGLWLGAEDGRAALYDARGRRIEDYTEVTRARATAEQRVRELAAELRRLQGERGRRGKS
jgi:Uma2 family endonuclease